MKMYFMSNVTGKLQIKITVRTYLLKWPKSETVPTTVLGEEAAL